MINRESGDTPPNTLDSHRCGRNAETGTEYVAFRAHTRSGEQFSLGLWRDPHDHSLWFNVDGQAQGNGNNGYEEKVREYLARTNPPDANEVKRILEI